MGKPATGRMMRMRISGHMLDGTDLIRGIQSEKMQSVLTRMTTMDGILLARPNQPLAPKGGEGLENPALRPFRWRNPRADPGVS